MNVAENKPLIVHKTFSTKSFDVNDISQDTFEIKGYLTTFGNKDLVGDVIEKGAFTDSIEVNETKSLSIAKEGVVLDKKSLDFVKALNNKTAESVNTALKSVGNVTFDDVAGGALIPEIMANEIWRPIFNENTGAIVSLPNTKLIKNKIFIIPALSSIPVGTREGECKPANLSRSKFSQRKLVAKRLGVTIQQSWEFQVFNALYTIQTMFRDIRESFTGTLAYEILQGNGNTEYLGVLTDDRIKSISTTTANLMSYDDIINLTSALKMGQDPVFVMHRSVWGVVQKIKDKNDRPIVVQDMANPTRKLLLGYPVIIVGDAFVADTDNPQQVNGTTYYDGILKPLMPGADLLNNQIASNTKAIIFGDFKRGYVQNIAQSLFIQADPFTKGNENCIRYYANSYNDGMPVLPDAFVTLQVK